MSESISAIINELRSHKTEILEPGLLAVFRMVAGLQLILIVIGLIVAVIMVDNGPPITLLRTSLFWLTALSIYLSCPGLSDRMGKWFLPPALFGGALMPIIDRVFFLRFMMADAANLFSLDRVEDSGWRMLVFLLFPLVITAWQYNIQHVLLYAIGTSLVGIGLNGWVFGWGSLIFRGTWPIAIGQAIVLTLIGYVVIRMINAQREQRTALTDANEKLTHYAATADQLATSRERNRLARELHDTLSHTLSSLSVQLEAADSVWEDAPDQARNLLVKSIANTRSGLAETRRALQELRASPLEDLGLGLALRNVAESMTKRAGLALVLDVPKQVDGLSDDQEQSLYRITQEALENVVKHANAKKLHLSLRQDEHDRWLLAIRDDGTGFDSGQESENGHYGLKGMQERVAILGGALHVESRIGTGTEIQVVL